MIIYKTTNILNNKIYIGKDVKNYNQYIGSGIYLKRAIKKYGKENFVKEIIEDNINDNVLLSEREIYWINHFNSTDKEIGYNLHTGGQGGDLSQFFKENSRLGKTYEELFGIEKATEMKENARNRVLGNKNPMFGSKLSQEHIDKLIKSNSRIKGPFSQAHIDKIRIGNLGKKVSDETRKKQSEAHENRDYSGTTVKQIDSIGNIIHKFNSIANAAKFYTVHRNKIYRNLIQDVNLVIERSCKPWSEERKIRTKNKNKNGNI
jgi:group I intron endonuclease